MATGKTALKKKVAAPVAEQPKPVEIPQETVKPIKETVKKSVTKVDNKQPKDERETIVKDESFSTGVAITTDPTRRVGMSKTMTINMGNYQSAKIGVWIECTIPDNDRDEANTITAVSERLDNYLQVEIEELKK